MGVWERVSSGLRGGESQSEGAVVRGRSLSAAQRRLLVMLNPGVRWISLGGGVATTFGALA